MKLSLQPLFLLIALMANVGCSTLGSMAKSSFSMANGFYQTQPESVRDNYPHFFKKVFYTSELLTTDYRDWKIRLTSTLDIEGYLTNNLILVRLEYELNDELYEQKVPLIYLDKKGRGGSKSEYFTYDFTFSPEGRDFWLGYHKHLFKMSKPWFTYPVSPELPVDIRNNIIGIHYRYAVNWPFLTLKEFMDLFELNTDERWEQFCASKTYLYDAASVCGEVTINDS